ncbi:MAG: hypothetical protein ABI431_04495 [Candidatus Tumulicola sp.]
MKYIAILSLGVALLTAPALSQMKPPVPMTTAQFGHAVTGQSIAILVRVVAYKRTSLSAELLDRESDSVYKSTGKIVDLYLPEDTPFVMGSFAGIKPGAALFVYGVATTRGRADIKKIIVLTGYIRVE